MGSVVSFFTCVRMEWWIAGRLNGMGYSLIFADTFGFQMAFSVSGVTLTCKSSDYENHHFSLGLIAFTSKNLLPVRPRRFIKENPDIALSDDSFDQFMTKSHFLHANSTKETCDLWFANLMIRSSHLMVIARDDRMISVRQDETFLYLASHPFLRRSLLDDSLFYPKIQMTFFAIEPSLQERWIPANFPPRICVLRTNLTEPFFYDATKERYSIFFFFTPNLLLPCTFYKNKCIQKTQKTNIR